MFLQSFLHICASFRYFHYIRTTSDDTFYTKRHVCTYGEKFFPHLLRARACMENNTLDNRIFGYYTIHYIRLQHRQLKYHQSHFNKTHLCTHHTRNQNVDLNIKFFVCVFSSHLHYTYIHSVVQLFFIYLYSVECTVQVHLSI